MVTVRFAPSPTGYLHIGGARTALFNFLYARNQKGRFLLRIEDTDRERSKPEFEKEILDSLKWLGLDWDGDPLRQSERIEVYRKEAENLLKRGLAFEEEKGGRRALLFRMPKRVVEFEDGLRGRVRFDTELFEDLVLLKSDGYPTYHWACVVDDHHMGITDVIRGEDHLSNTPKQMLLFEASGWPPPRYVHLPLILGSDGTPLSKRHGAVAVSYYHNEGFLAEGLANYLALLGWGPEGNQEFFRLNELIEKFSLKRLVRSAARFDLAKLRWMNAQHLRSIPAPDYLDRVGGYLPGFSRDRLNRTALLFRARIETLKDLSMEAAYCLKDVDTYQLEAMDRALKTPDLRQMLEVLRKDLEALPDFEDVVKLESTLRNLATGQGVEAKVLIHPLRLALTGKGVSPGIFELMQVLGKEQCLKRLGRFIEKL